MRSIGLFSFPLGTEMCHFPRCPSAASRQTQNVKCKSQNFGNRLRRFIKIFVRKFPQFCILIFDFWIRCETALDAGSQRRVFPFGDPRIKDRLPSPRGLSQAATSFIGLWCQGIHHMLYLFLIHHLIHNRSCLARDTQINTDNFSRPKSGLHRSTQIKSV